MSLLMDLAPLLGGAVLAFFGVFLYKKGGNNKEKDLEIDDYENAENIRRRVSRDRADRVRKLDGAGWRD